MQQRPVAGDNHGYVRASLFLARGAVYPLTAPPRLPSVEPAFAALFLATRHLVRPSRRAGGIKLGHVGGQVHGGQNHPGVVLPLDEGNQAQRPLALRAEASVTDAVTRVRVTWDAPETMPARGNLVQVYFVARDMRGGLAYIERAVCLQ
jgi:hypothetical protein